MGKSEFFVVESSRDDRARVTIKLKEETADLLPALVGDRGVFHMIVVENGVAALKSSDDMYGAARVNQFAKWPMFRLVVLDSHVEADRGVIVVGDGFEVRFCAQL